MDEDRIRKIIQEDKVTDISVGLLFIALGVLFVGYPLAYFDYVSMGFKAGLIIGGLIAAVGTMLFVSGIRR